MNKILLFLQNNKYALLILCLLGFLFFGVRAFRGAGSKVKRSSRVKRYLKRGRLYSVRAYTWVLNRMEKIPVIGDIVGNTAYSYKCHEAMTNEEASLRTGKTLFLSIAVFVSAMLFGMYWFGDIIIPTITAFMLAHVTTTMLRSKPQKFLNGLRDAMEDFLLAYHKSGGNIDAAFHAVAQTQNLVARHFNVMHDYIKRAYVSQTPEMIQNEYNAIAPSRYLRNIFAIIYMTYKFGDQKEDGRSALNKNLMEVQEQIGDILYQQNKILDESMGERWFIILPVYAIPLVSSYMLKYFSFEGFEFINAFIESSAGYMVSVLCAGISLVCYLMYTRMADRGILEAKVGSDWAKKALQYNAVRRATAKLLPKDSPKRKTMATTMKKAGLSESVDAMQVRRTFVALVLTVIALVSSVINLWQNTSTLKNDIYTGLAKPHYENMILTQDDSKTYVKEMLDADWKIMKQMRKTDGYYSMNEEDQKTAIRTYMKESGLIDKYRNYESYGITRIQAKMIRRQNTSALNIVLFIMFMGVLGYFMPYVLVFLQARMNKELLLIDETSDLQKMTIMLTEYPQTTPDSLLSWYASSSMLMAPQLRECAVTHDFDALLNTSEYKPFIQLATCLQMSFKSLSLKEAFSGVEQRLLTQRKEQSRIMDRILKFRTKTIEVLTSVSMGAVIALYMFMPLLVSMVQMFMSLDIFK